jgi:hypothetical protein
MANPRNRLDLMLARLKTWNFRITPQRLATMSAETRAEAIQPETFSGAGPRGRLPGLPGAAARRRAQDSGSSSIL